MSYNNFGLRFLVLILSTFALTARAQLKFMGWGNNVYGQSSELPDVSNIKAIAAGQYYSVALKEDGSVVAWGDNGYDQINVPLGLSHVKAITSGANP